MVRFCIASGDVAGDSVKVDGENFHYLRDVLRVDRGETLIAFDGTGKEYICTVGEINPRHIDLSITQTLKSRTEASVEIHLVQSLIRMNRFTFVLQKCTELGVKRFLPVITERTVVRLKGDKKERCSMRWQKLVREAARQCGRGVYPDIEPVKDLKSALGQSDSCDLSIIPWEEEKSLALKEVLRDRKDDRLGKVMVFIGPEGGFTKTEISSARDAGVVPVSLGPRLLRSETAAAATTAILIHELEK